MTSFSWGKADTSGPGFEGRISSNETRRMEEAYGVIAAKMAACGLDRPKTMH
jgi:hypothetical protein